MQKKIFLGVVIILLGLFLITLSVVKQSAQISVTPIEKPLVESGATILPVGETDPFYGNPGSAITVDEFFSFNCASCASLHEQLISFINAHPDQVRLRSTGILKTNWLGQPDDSLPFLALVCASSQEKYWPFLEKTFKLSSLDETNLKSLAKELEMNEAKFDACLKNETTKTEMQNKQTVLQSSGLSETPLVFVNNRRINLTDDFKIDVILNGIIVK